MFLSGIKFPLSVLGRKPTCWQCGENRNLSAVFPSPKEKVCITLNHSPLLMNETNKKTDNKDQKNGVTLFVSAPETAEKEGD